MPNKVIADEGKWEKAKAAAEKQGKADNYALIMSIYKKMGGATKKQKKEVKFTKSEKDYGTGKKKVQIQVRGKHGVYTRQQNVGRKDIGIESVKQDGKNFHATIDKNKVTFTNTGANKYSVEINGEHFANVKGVKSRFEMIQVIKDAIESKERHESFDKNQKKSDDSNIPTKAEIESYKSMFGNKSKQELDKMISERKDFINSGKITEERAKNNIEKQIKILEHFKGNDLSKSGPAYDEHNNPIPEPEGKMKFQGLTLCIEHYPGSIRSGKKENNTGWSTVFKYPYGYIKGTKGNDGDGIDCYVGKFPNSDRVFIIKQLNPSTRAFDEDKVMLGFPDKEMAKEAYLMHYDSPAYFGGMIEMSMKDFKKKLKKKKTIKFIKSEPAFGRELDDKGNFAILGDTAKYGSPFDIMAPGVEHMGGRLIVDRGILTQHDRVPSEVASARAKLHEAMAAAQEALQKRKIGFDA